MPRATGQLTLKLRPRAVKEINNRDAFPPLKEFIDQSRREMRIKSSQKKQNLIQGISPRRQEVCDSLHWRDATQRQRSENSRGP